MRIYPYHPSIWSVCRDLACVSCWQFTARHELDESEDMSAQSLLTSQLVQRGAVLALNADYDLSRNSAQPVNIASHIDLRRHSVMCDWRWTSNPRALSRGERVDFAFLVLRSKIDLEMVCWLSKKDFCWNPRKPI
jgi:hypothetical protein